ncbi:uncharacterized protein K452DRAFT_267755 [Aplosporella prunicola CBS 121167]|uniref:Spindle pole body component n=1 Tax=Aplosporella prunicola CBS 121167 TaxID=1176127 RepID=A0A6A6BHG3_9PEZI|nr:uncharacterized protein K452DRAFT_267755 [Aplosporella prunicola CBS 121167]KAF2143580.1 hypothetical protein K452DRAFT_267755 [Aplosporella prunicola CBS 121167]
MLHEILLSLSGHPSPLFDSVNPAAPGADDENNYLNTSFPLLSPPEAELLASVGRLAHLHRSIRHRAQLIAASHSSTICRAVATAVTAAQLARFQRKVLEVEEKVLKRDAEVVGAYNIVPLSGIVAEFEGWTRRLEWLWRMCGFMLPEEGKAGEGECTGADLINKLRREAQTGYPDVETAALELGKVAETAWLRQLSTWVLYGRLPVHGSRDFFITQVQGEDGLVDYIANSKLLPKFVSVRTASSILFIGRSLDQIRNRGAKAAGPMAPKMSELELLPVHLKFLSDLKVPVSSAALSEAIAAIRLSLSRNTLQQLLPLPKILQILSLLQEFFLLGRGEFAVALIEESDERVRLRHRRTDQNKPGKGVRGVLVKEGEVTAVLTRTWASLASLIDDEEMTDESLDLARNLVHLSLSKPTSTRPSTPGRAKESADALPKLTTVAFNDLLLSVPTALTLDISPPLDLFLSPAEVDVYSTIHAYLLAIRRAHLRLTDLWRQSHIRRDYPAPLGPPHSNSAGGQRTLRERRERTRRRAVAMRKVWATCSAAVFLLSELGSYFEGEVVQESWHHFRRWIVGGEMPTAAEEQRPGSAASGSGATTRPPTSSTAAASARAPHLPSRQQQQQHHHHQHEHDRRPPHDPEALATAHRAFLTTLTHALLLTDRTLPHQLRAFLAHADELVALTRRLQSAYAAQDLEADAGVVDALADHGAEAEEAGRELDRARKRVDADLRALVGRLRERDGEGDGGGVGAGGVGGGAYVPWRGAGVDRLLMKLDFGAGAGEEGEEGEGNEEDEVLALKRGRGRGAGAGGDGGEEIQQLIPGV